MIRMLAVLFALLCAPMAMAQTVLDASSEEALTASSASLPQAEKDKLGDAIFRLVVRKGKLSMADLAKLSKSEIFAIYAPMIDGKTVEEVIDLSWH